MAQVLREILMYDRGDRVHIADPEDDSEKRGSVDHDLGGAVVHVFVDGKNYGLRHRGSDPIPRGRLTLIPVDADGYDIDEDGE